MDFLHQIPGVFQYISQNPAEFWGEVETQLQLSGYALLIALVLAFPVGVLASRSRLVSLYSVNLVGVARAIPSVALLFLMFPLLGGGFQPSVAALTVLAIPPILINTNVGFREVDPAVREAAEGMGMNTLQVLRRVEFPLALPVILAGVRTAAVEVIASATLATFIGGGGLGDYITEGLAMIDVRLILVGALPVAVLTLLAEVILSGIERTVRQPAT
ncbi:MAG TPA: ABC transporter permease [Chloroflexota bacterium]|nr:ABC transporter permease [Chloroflexota bacterium]